MAWLLALIVILAVGGLVALSLKSPPKTPQIHSDQQPNGAAKREAQRNHNTTTANQPSTIEQQQPSSDAQREADKGAEKRADEAREYWPFHIFGARLKITDSLLAFFTVLLIVVGAIQGFFLYHTDQGTHKAAQAAEDSANVARDTLIATQRPWLSFENVKIVGPLTFDEIGGHLPITFTVRNSGNSTAVGTYVHSRVIWSDKNPFDVM